MAINAKLTVRVYCDSCLARIERTFDEQGEIGSAAFRARYFSRSCGWTTTGDDEDIKDVCPSCRKTLNASAARKPGEEKGE